MPRPFEPLTLEDFAALLDHFDFDRAIDAVHLHHTWRPRSAQYAGEATIDAMWRYHTREKGWSDIAQHVSIAPDGTIWTGRDWNVPPASAVGYNGNHAVGPFMIEMIGDFDDGEDVLEGRQRSAVVDVIARVQAKFDLHDDTLRFHNQMTNEKSCPGTSVRRDQLLREIDLRRQDLARETAASRFDGATKRTLDERIARLLRRLRTRSATADGAAREGTGELDESGMTVEQEIALGRADQPAGSRAAGARSALTPQMLDELRPHLVNLEEGRFSRDGRFRTRPGDVDAIFDLHLPRALEAAKKRAGKLHVVFWAHGGLIAEEAGLQIAHQQLAWWKRNHVYPIFFVWETGFLDALAQILRGTRERALRRDFADRFTDPVVEDLARQLGGGKIWSAMKRSAELASGSEGGARSVAERLARFCAQPGSEAVALHAVGHSAGSIFHAHFLPCATGLGARFASLHLLAPAIRVDLFKRNVVPLVGSRIGQLSMFTMRRDFEEDDSVAVYRKSLLYLVSRAFEPEKESPILGLEESVQDDQELRRLFGLTAEGSAAAEIVWSVSEKDAGRTASTSRTHGGFDNDRATMNSVLRRVLDKSDTDPIFDFPPEATERARAAMANATRAVDETPLAGDDRDREDAPRADRTARTTSYASRSFGGARRALCIGIDEYSVSPLAGCVADAISWSDTLRALRFDTTRLLNHEATREAILAGVGDLVRGSRAGDVLALQFAGHGTLVDDLDGDEVGGNGAKDEALCPYDFASGALVIDDDLAEVFAQLPPGVNLTCFMDSCHSGTVTRLVAGTAAHAGRDRRARFLRATPELQAAHRAFRGARGPARRGTRGSTRGPDSMREVLFSACLDREQAIELDGHGEFTVRATAILRDGIDGLTHAEFERRVIAAFGSSPAQHPQLDCAPAARERSLLAPLDASFPSHASANGAGAHPTAARPGANGALHDIAGEIRDRADRLLRL